MEHWIERLESILKLNGREILTHAGEISHNQALKKSNEEYQKFKEIQKKQEKEYSLKELENDLKGVLKCNEN
jgi:hypothetical protein